MSNRQVYTVEFIRERGRWCPVTGGGISGTMTIHEARHEAATRNAEKPQSKSQSTDYCGAMGIGGIGIYAENEMPSVPSVRAIERMEKLEKRARRCRRCGQTDVFDGAMFTTGGGDVCDDCF